MFTPSIAAITFGIIFVAELPDKTALAVLVLGTRYRADYVFAGVAAAFAVHVTVAVAAGSVLALLPYRWLQGISGLLFLAGAVLLLLRKDNDEEEEVSQSADQGFWKVAGAGFTLVLIAEFGDLTQIMTANLAAHYRAPLAVGLGAVLGLWAVAGLGILGGRTLIRYVRLRLITQIAAAAMAVLAALSLYRAVRGLAVLSPLAAGPRNRQTAGQGLAGLCRPIPAWHGHGDFAGRAARSRTAKGVWGWCREVCRSTGRRGGRGEVQGAAAARTWARPVLASPR